jgi:hypothetical protein
LQAKNIFARQTFGVTSGGLMKNASGWSYLVTIFSRFSLGWAQAAALIGLLAVLSPAMTIAKTRATTITSFNGSGVTLRAYINNILKQNKLADGVDSAPHQNFWDKLNYKEFTTGTIPGVTEGPNPPYRILVVGDGANSNLVMALQGKGPLFNKDNGAFGRMPANAEPPEKPYFTDEQIQPIIAWINKGCPNPRGK